MFCFPCVVFPEQYFHVDFGPKKGAPKINPIISEGMMLHFVLHFSLVVPEGVTGLVTFDHSHPHRGKNIAYLGHVYGLVPGESNSLALLRFSAW